MPWSKIKTSLALILDGLDATFRDVECDRDEFSPLLTVHPPALRNTRREMIDSQMEYVDAAWDQILLVEARVLELKEEIKKTSGDASLYDTLSDIRSSGRDSTVYNPLSQDARYRNEAKYYPCQPRVPALARDYIFHERCILAGHSSQRRKS